MVARRITVRLLSSALILGSVGGTAMAQAVKPEAALSRVPAVAGITISTPTAAELANCKAEKREWAANSKGVKPVGLIVTDGNGRKLRQFISTTGDSTYNILSYFTDGVESFREVDTNGNGKPDTFRWLGSNGSKQGVDSDEDGIIDQWVTISPEEVAQEIFAAVQNNDKRRLKALLLSEAELKSLALPAADEARIKQKIAAAETKLGKANAELQLTAKAKWMHAEISPPQTTPRDTLGTAEDFVKHRSVPVLFDAGDGKSMSYLSTGEMVLVGKAWKLVDGPAKGTPSDETLDPNVAVVPEAIREIVTKIGTVPPPKDGGDMQRYHLERAALLEKCVAGTEGAQQLPWLKQLIDAYSAAIESAPNDRKVLDTLLAWQKAINDGGADETKAYVAYRRISAEFAVLRKEVGNDNTKLAKMEAARKVALEDFVKSHPASGDAPEAIMQLAMAAEFTQNGEATAKQWYEKLIKDYSTHNHALKASGALKRLTSEGKPFDLAGETLDNKPFTTSDLGGKPAVVFYWASWGTTADEDLKQLAQLEKDYSKKGLAVVSICLDEDATKAAAVGMLRSSKLGGYQLYAAGGLDRSPLAVAYGVHMVPHVFLVDKDGKVASRNAQFGPSLKDEVEKLMK